MLPTEDPARQTPTGIHYPESDHMAESGMQKRVCDRLINLMRSYFESTEERPMLVGGNQFMYLREGDVDLRLAPDVYVIEDEVLGMDDVKSWRIWEHEGKGPALAVEVVSDEYEKDYDPAQLLRYQQLGVRELIRYDPEFYLHRRAQKFGTRRLLTHWVRTPAGALQEQPLFSKLSIRSTLYDCWFVHQPPHSLRIGVGPSGRRLWPTDAERAASESQRASAEAERAAAEAARAATEAARADKAEAELARLRAELEQLRQKT